MNTLPPSRTEAPCGSSSRSRFFWASGTQPIRITSPRCRPSSPAAASGPPAAPASSGSLGAGHAVTLFAFGLPILLLDSYLPERAQQAAETAIAVVIVYLAVRLLLRWRRGDYHEHVHGHGGEAHSHVHARHDHRHPRSRLGAFGIGLVHGMGGSAGVGILVVASVESTPLAVVSLALLALFTAVSMTLLSGGFGRTLVSRPMRSSFGTVAPVLGAASLAFGLWYATSAWSLTPYPF